MGPPLIMSSSFPPFSCYRVSSIHLPSMVHVVFLPLYHPHTICHVSPSLHISLPLKGIHHTYSSTSFAYRILPCVPLSISPSLRHRGPITSFPCPTSHVVLPSYPLSRSVIPGGCMGGPPYPEGAELAGPSSILMLQLLKWLVVVRHLLRHNGKARP
jgi:hypothetical protein